MNVKLNLWSRQKNAVSVGPTRPIAPPSDSMKPKLRSGCLPLVSVPCGARSGGIGHFSNHSMNVSMASSGKSFFRKPLRQYWPVPGHAVVDSVPVYAGSVPRTRTASMLGPLSGAGMPSSIFSTQAEARVRVAVVERAGPAHRRVVGAEDEHRQHRQTLVDLVVHERAIFLEEQLRGVQS